MRFILSVLLSLVIVTPAFAHKIRVFAYQEGAHIITESHFSGGRAAQGAKVKAIVDGQNISIGTTDTHGVYQFRIPKELSLHPVNIDIITQTDDGHKAQWTLLAEDIRSVQDMPQTDIQDQENAIEIKKEPQATAQSATSPLTEHAIRIIVQEELAKGLAPINRELSEKKPTFQDILGGIGYIFGLLGIAAFFTSRKR